MFMTCFSMAYSEINMYLLDMQIFALYLRFTQHPNLAFIH